MWPKESSRCGINQESVVILHQQIMKVLTRFFIEQDRKEIITVMARFPMSQDCKEILIVMARFPMSQDRKEILIVMARFHISQGCKEFPLGLIMYIGMNHFQDVLQ